MTEAPAAEIRLTCQPGREGNLLVFPYKVENLGAATAYVMDAVATIDGATGAAKPWHGSVVVVGSPEEHATLGRFMPPLPVDRRIAMPVLPLARVLSAGASFEGRLDVPLPLAEASPYFADLPLREYEMVEIKAVLFTLAYWVAGEQGAAALPLEDTPDLCSVVSRNTTRSARSAAQRFPVRSLQLLRRKDPFPRDLPGAAGKEAG
jgi:hypothetical protein